MSSTTASIVMVVSMVVAYWIGYGRGSWRGRRVGYRDGETAGYHRGVDALTEAMIDKPTIDLDHIAHLAGWRAMDRHNAAEFDAWCQYCGQKAGHEFTNVQSRVINGTYHPGCLALLEAELRETGNL